jgi:hypothetical protein
MGGGGVSFTTTSLVGAVVATGALEGADGGAEGTEGGGGVAAAGAGIDQWEPIQTQAVPFCDQ